MIPQKGSGPIEREFAFLFNRLSAFSFQSTPECPGAKLENFFVESLR